MSETKQEQSYSPVLNNFKDASPDWTNRRKLIFYTMGFLGACNGLITLSAVLVMILSQLLSKEVHIDQSVTGLLTTVIYANILLASITSASYVFGANYDYSSFRHLISNLTVAKTTADTVVAVADNKQ